MIYKKSMKPNRKTKTLFELDMEIEKVRVRKFYPIHTISESRLVHDIEEITGKDIAVYIPEEPVRGRPLDFWLDVIGYSPLNYNGNPERFINCPSCGFSFIPKKPVRDYEEKEKGVKN